ncbi:MAG: PASTA domain-containing protein [Planctomycetota bacterium]|nr:PASTA domain-containing protein [Planctomycetota bacterium]
MRSRLGAALGALLALALVVPDMAWAAPREEDEKPAPAQLQAISMPFVEGANVEEAIKRLEQLRLQVRVITIAGRPVDIVDRQEPKPNSVLQPGAEVVLFVGIEPFVQTIVPDVRGMTYDELVLRVEEAYVLDIELVDGERRDAGRVIQQQPRAGRRLALRGVLSVKIVRPSVLVPALIGKSEAEARALVDALGLVIDVDYVPQAAMAPDRVMSQDPRTGAEIVPGGVVRVQISGDGGALPDLDRTVVPRLLGATLVEAQRLVHEAGLIPRPSFASVSGVRAFTVVRQQEPAGALLRIGDAVRFTVALPTGTVTTVRVPSLLGMRGDEATQLLSRLGLRPVVTRRVSGLPPGTVLQQSPGSGRRVDAGSRVVLTVAARPPVGWQETVVVPRVVGLDVLRARAALLASGLAVQIQRAEAPGEPVDRIAHQSPGPGRRVRHGATVRIVLPLSTRMPELLGKTKQRAAALLQSAGLRGVAEGPDFGVGTTQVVRQGIAPGVALARGTRVPFQYVFTGTTGVVRVPNLIGLTRQRATAVLTAAGLNGIYRGGTSPLHRVNAQSLAPGTRVPRGTSLVVTLAATSVPPAVNTVRVPSVVNRSLREARELLTDAGLTIRLEATGNVTDASIVRAQAPAAGTRVARGTRVVLRMQAPVQPGTVAVPDVVGKSKRRAVERLEAAGLRVKIKGLDVEVRGIRTKVRKQDPAPGTVVVRGSEVTITLGF